MARLSSLLIGATLAVAVLAAGSAAASSSPMPTKQLTRSVLAPGQQLRPGDQVVSPDGLHALVMQTDGKLVLRAGGLAVWSTHTEGHSGTCAVLQPDGNLVLRDGPTALWASGTASKHDKNRVTLLVQDDGNLVLHRSSEGSKPNAIWQSNTPDSALRQVRVRTGCPSGLTGNQQRANAPEGLTTSLVPTGVTPDSALVCRYSGIFTPNLSAPKLLQTTKLGPSGAGRLATALGKVTLGPSTAGTYPCPSGDGSATIIALHYPHRSSDVDVDVATSGCRSVSNGYYVAGHNGNPSFDAFQSELSQLAPIADGLIGER